MAYLIGIIGCGNPSRTDDGAGSAVIRELKRHPSLADNAHIKLFDAGTDGMSVLFAARGVDALIIIDASKTGSEPGTIFQVPASELVKPHQPSMNLHDFRWDHALYAGRQIFKDSFPSDIVVYLIEAASLDMGLELTPGVAAAAMRVASKIIDDCARYQNEHAAVS